MPFAKTHGLILWNTLTDGARAVFRCAAGLGPARIEGIMPGAMEELEAVRLLRRDINLIDNTPVAVLTPRGKKLANWIQQFDAAAQKEPTK
jgi:hypothetical protein